MKSQLPAERLKWFLENHARWEPHHSSVWAGGILRWGKKGEYHLDAYDPFEAIDRARASTNAQIPIHPKHHLRHHVNEECVEYHDYHRWVAAHTGQMWLVTPERAYLAGRSDERVASQLLSAPHVGVNPPDRKVWVDYTNWEGVRGVRAIVPHQLYWGHTQYHPSAQWLLRGLDCSKQQIRDFSLVEIGRIGQFEFSLQNA